MKRTLLPLAPCATILAAGLLAATPALRAELVAYLDFEDAPFGALHGYDGGTGFGAFTALGGATVAVSNFVFTGATATVDGGSAIATHIGKPSNNSYVWYAPLETPQNGQHLFLSFLFRANDSVGNSTSDDFFSLGFAGPAGSEPKVGVCMRRPSGSTRIGWGLRYSDKNVICTDCPVDAERTYFVVLHAEKANDQAATKFKKLSLYVDPDPGAGEPATPTLTSDTDTTVPTAYYLSSRIANSMAEDTDGYGFDEIRVGTTWADVTGPVTHLVTPRPMASPHGGAFHGSQTVSLAVPGVATPTIRYTLDGSAPTAASAVYTGPLVLTDSATLRAYASSPAIPDSLVVEAAFTAIADEILWTGAGGDALWTTLANWDTGASPVGAIVTFGADGRAAQDVVNNILPDTLSIASLCYTNNSAFPAPATSGAHWHTLSIPPAATLHITGRDARGHTVSMLGPPDAVGRYDAGVEWRGGGAVAVSRPADGEFLLSHSTTFPANATGAQRENARGAATLDAHALGSLSVDVATIWIGKGYQTKGTLVLPANDGVGTSLLRASDLHVGDGGGNTDRSIAFTSELLLGQSNTIQADAIFVGASGAGIRNDESGRVAFQSGLAGATLVLRGRDGGASRADLHVGTQGQGESTPRGISGTLDLAGGAADLRLGTFLVGEGSGFLKSNTDYGSAVATFAMDGDDTVDADTFVLGRTTYRSGDRNNTATRSRSTAAVAGGTLRVNGDAWVGLNAADSWQSLDATLAVSGGLVDIAGALAVGTRLGGATGITARVALTGGMLRAGSLALGDAALADGNDAPILDNTLSVEGGTADVSGELRVEQGSVELRSGSLAAGSLVATNALSRFAFLVAAPAAPSISVAGDILLGGGLTLVEDESAPLPAGTAIPVESAAGTRKGEFDSASLPDGWRLRYTASGFTVLKPALASIVLFR